jgi:hypothetical protein
MRVLRFQNIQYNEDALNFYLVCIYERIDRQTSDADPRMSTELYQGIAWSI